MIVRALAAASCGVPASSPVALLTRIALRGDHDLGDVVALFGDVELCPVRLEELRHVGIGDRDLLRDLVIEDLLGEQLTAQALAHVRLGQAPPRQLLLELFVVEVALRLGERGVEVGGRHLDLERRRLRDEEILEDQIVQHRQLRGDRFLGGERLVRIADAAEDLLGGVLRDRPPVDDGPRVGRDRGLAGGLRRGAGGRQDGTHERAGQDRAGRDLHERTAYCRNACRDNRHATGRAGRPVVSLVTA